MFADAVNRTVPQVTREEFGDFPDVPNSGVLKAKNVQVVLLCLLLLLLDKSNERSCGDSFHLRVPDNSLPFLPGAVAPKKTRVVLLS